MYNVLVFPCGSQPAIDVNFALRYASEIRLFGASSVDDHGRFVYKNYIGGLPNIADEGFLSRFSSVLEQYQIDFVIPTHDSVALFLMENQHVLCAQIIAGNVDAVRVCRYKSLTYQLFRSYPFVPKVFDCAEAVCEFPVFIKPDSSQGGKGAVLAKNECELRRYTEYTVDPVISEFLPGDEITIDCFTDRHGVLRFIGPRTRERTLAGIAVRSRTIPVTAEIQHVATVIHSKLEFRGYWFFQMKRGKSGEYKLLEISSRMAGTACLNISRGVNFSLLSILDRAGQDIEILSNEYIIELDRSLVNRYLVHYQFSTVYLDWQSVQMANRQINSYLMMFLYQCLNQNKEVILISRGDEDISESLRHYRIDRGLFSEIVQVKHSSPILSFVQGDKAAIFISHSSMERKMVGDASGIPVLDINNIDSLIDWRA